MVDIVKELRDARHTRISILTGASGAGGVGPPGPPGPPGDGGGFATVTSLLNDTSLSYGTSDGQVAAGDIVEAGGHRYQAAASGATDHHITTSGGVRLYVLPGASGYSIKAFGAAVDGTTNDGPIIQAAVNAVTDGSTIHFPRGTCFAGSSQIVVNTKGITFRGEHRDYSILRFTDGAYTAIRTSTTGIQEGAQFTVMDMSIRGSTNVFPLLQLFDFTNNSPYIIIQRCSLNFADVLIRLGETYVVKINDNLLGNANQGIIALNDGSQADLIIQGNTFGTFIDNTSAVLDLAFTSVNITGNYFESQAQQKPTALFKTGCQRVVFGNNILSDENGYLLVQTSVNATITGNFFHNTYDPTSGRCIRVDGGAVAVISGNTFDLSSAAAGNGISSSGAAVITGNIFRNCRGTAVAAPAAGTVVGNMFASCGTGVSSASGCEETVVALNAFQSSVTTPINLQGGDPIVAFNHAATVTESASSASVFGNYPRRPATYERHGFATYNPPSLADGASATTTVAVSGAALGDFVDGVSFSLDLQGVTVTAWVSAANTVSVRFHNETGGVIDLAEGSLRVKTRKGS